MNLIIDQGNTKSKIAFFKDCELLKVEEALTLSEEEIDKVVGETKISNCILASVKVVPERLLDFLRKRFSCFVFLTHTTPLPIRIGYKTPHTLGMDRVAAVTGASFEKSGEPLIVIDAGTAVTYDFMDEHRTFKGGNIAPGLNMRLLALHRFTDKLPLISPTGETPEIGFNTETAIRSGAVLGICYEIEGFISQIKREYPSVLVFLTGGDSFFLAEKIKYPIFVDKNLVLKGLNRILNYNVEK
ncbi:MAG: type III pantothenate kinase [Bacteroidales bacterium]